MTRTKWSLVVIAATFIAGQGLAAEPPPPDRPALIAANSRSFAFADGRLSGSGADFLAAATADSQFVLLGEDHYLHDTPLFSAALYRMLYERHGFGHLVVEQDRYAMEDVLAPGRRGDAARIGQWVGRYPGSFEFGSDQDIELLALAGRLGKGPVAICGIEQGLGAPRYLDELIGLAPSARVKAELVEFRALAQKLDPEPTYSVNFLIAAGMTERLAKLRADFAAKPGSRADEMLFGLLRSSEIFGYYRRAEAGEHVGLYNNTVRESWFKRLFMDCYRRMAKGERQPKAMFKFGSNHMFHGKNPTQAFPIGNFVHELAIANGSTAFGIMIVPLLGEGYKDVPPELRALLPRAAPEAPIVVDLRAFRPVQRFLRASLSDSETAAFREIVNGYEAIVVLPNEQPATMKLSGLKPL